MKRLLACLSFSLLIASASAQQDDRVEFGYVEWPGVTVKTHVATQVLEALGFETDMQALSVPLILRGLSEGDLDAFLGVWRPSMDPMIEDYLEESGDGSVTLVTTNLEPTIYQPGVPTFVAEEMGITSFSDVADDAEAFDGRIYGIEPGNDGNEIILDMIENDTYGFADMELVESSTQGMLTAVGDAIEDREPIVFLAWSPHWMNEVYDITYLDDPENVWGGDGFVATGVNTEWADANANLARFLEQFQVTPEMQNGWIDTYSREGNDPSQVAESWIRNNLDTVTGWLQGVEARDGGSAEEAVTSAFGG